MSVHSLPAPSVCAPCLHCPWCEQQVSAGLPFTWAYKGLHLRIAASSSHILDLAVSSSSLLTTHHFSQTSYIINQLYYHVAPMTSLSTTTNNPPWLPSQPPSRAPSPIWSVRGDSTEITPCTSAEVSDAESDDGGDPVPDQHHHQDGAHNQGGAHDHVTLVNHHHERNTVYVNPHDYVSRADGTLTLGDVLEQRRQARRGGDNGTESLEWESPGGRLQ